MPACHTILGGVGVVVFRVKSVTNVVVGVYNTVFVVISMMYIECEIDNVHSLLYNMVVTCFVIYSFTGELGSPGVSQVPL